MHSNNNQTPIVSVIVPVYNVEAYLERCIASLISQTLENIEIILVDDGSTDNSPGICDKAAEVHHNITVIHKENGGVSSARNAGLDIATGKYISFIDSDDYVEPDMMELMVGRAEADGSQLVQCDITRHIKSEVKNNFFNVKNGNLDLKNHNLNEFNQIFGSDISVFLWDKIYERSIIENHKIRYLDMKYVLSEDQLFLICYCRFANQISFVDKALYPIYEKFRSAVARLK